MGFSWMSRCWPPRAFTQRDRLFNSEDATNLHSEQSVADYIAEPVVVKLPGNTQVSTARLTATNPEYAAALLALATKLGLPDSYLGHIRKAAIAS